MKHEIEVSRRRRRGALFGTAAVAIAPLALSACKSREQPAASEPAPTPVDTSTSGPAQARADMTPKPREPAAVDNGVRGPFPTIAAYCNDVFSRLRSVDCAESPSEIPADTRSGLCACDVADPKRLDGQVALRRNANEVVFGAAIVSVARNAHDNVRCELAVETDEGWFIAPELFACGLAPIADNNPPYHVVIKRLAIDETTNGGNVTLRWQSSLEAPGSGTVTCTYRSPGPLVCSREHRQVALPL